MVDNRLQLNRHITIFKKNYILIKKFEFFDQKQAKKCLKIFKSFHCLNLAILGQYPKDVVLRRDMPPYPSMIFFSWHE